MLPAMVSGTIHALHKGGGAVYAAPPPQSKRTESLNLGLTRAVCESGALEAATAQASPAVQLVRTGGETNRRLLDNWLSKAWFQIKQRIQESSILRLYACANIYTFCEGRQPCGMRRYSARSRCRGAAGASANSSRPCASRSLRKMRHCSFSSAIDTRNRPSLAALARKNRSARISAPSAPAGGRQVSVRKLIGTRREAWSSTRSMSQYCDFV
jgi:hypothetical protein